MKVADKIESKRTIFRLFLPKEKRISPLNFVAGAVKPFQRVKAAAADPVETRPASDGALSWAACEHAELERPPPATLATGFEEGAGNIRAV